MDEQSVRQSPSNILWGFELLVVTADALFLAGEHTPCNVATRFFLLIRKVRPVQC